jgi:ParB family chromosome partitioning protein
MSAIKTLAGAGSLSDMLKGKKPEGKPLLIDLAMIDEDPGQPREVFDEAALAELAKTIQDRGVKTPISVRDAGGGRYIINHGARRFRASKLAGLQKIPAMLDADYTLADQAIENIQREDLTALEIAKACRVLMEGGDNKSQVAARIGKSPAYVTMHLTLLKLPPVLDAVYQSGRCGGLLEINELVRAYKDDPVMVEQWLADEQRAITRLAIQALRESIKMAAQAEPATKPVGGPGTGPDAGFDAPGGADAGGGVGDSLTVKESDEPFAPDLGGQGMAGGEGGKLKKAILLVEFDGRSAALLLNKRPTSPGCGWIKYEDNGEESLVELGQLVINSIIEG